MTFLPRSPFSGACYRCRRFFAGSILPLVLLPIMSALADSPADIVPRGSAINDAFGLLARHDYLGDGVIASSFAGRLQYTRAQFATLLQGAFIDNSVK